MVIPAHNEQHGITRVVSSLAQAARLPGQFAIVVVADNCTDDTAGVAAEAGARVLIRRDETRRGKGYALDFAFQTLLAERYDYLIIVDADSVVERSFVREIQLLLSSGADAVQCRYQVANANDSLRTRLMSVALLAFNVLRPRGRDRLGLSAGILGNGFALRSATLQQVPYDASSVVEDLEYHLRLVQAGKRVRFADGTTVWGDMPAGGKGVATQRARWEGGRLLMLRRQGPRLLREVACGRWNMLEPLLDLLLLPLATHVAFLALTLAVPFPVTRVYAAAALAMVATHVVAAVFAGGGGRRELAALAAAPFYVIWKLTVLPLIVRTSRTDAAWVRTARKNNSEEAR